ncbi:MAG: GAK system CofD-like protein [Nitrospinae bacterium]|nr:GAK system CofD-like protein [Nitrospinota bacterium]
MALVSRRQSKADNYIAERDTAALSHYQIMPELGPRILFFSGGTAIKNLSRELIRYTHNSIHIVTPFDSGGSSAHIRKAFRMLAVGDLRNRLVALVDNSVQGSPNIQNILSCRFSKDISQIELEERLKQMIIGRDPLVAAIPDPHRHIIQMYLRAFLSRMPRDFDLRGASIGNLIITGGYLKKGRTITHLISLLSRLAEAKGVIRPITEENCHLAAELENGEMVIGQHLITGKETAPISSPIRHLYLSAAPDKAEKREVKIAKETEYLIKKADLICFPMGSFYSSIIANTLPDGVGKAVAESKCQKVYIPNTGTDPEQIGMTVHSSVATLVSYLQKTAPAKTPVGKLLNHVIVDGKSGSYPNPLDLEAIRKMGIGVIDANLATPRSGLHLDERLLATVLLTVTGHGKRKNVKKAVPVG